MTDPAGGRPDRSADTRDAVDEPSPTADLSAASGSLKDETTDADENTVYDGTGGRQRMTWSPVTEHGGAQRAAEPVESADRSSAFRFDLGGALARLAGDDPEPVPPRSSPPDERGGDAPGRAPVDPVAPRAATATPVEEPTAESAVESRGDVPDGPDTGDGAAFELNPLPLRSTATQGRQPPVADEQPNYPRRVPGTHLDRRHILDETPQVRLDVPEITEATPADQAPPPVARTSVFADHQVDRYDPSLRGIGTVGSPSLPGQPPGMPTLPVSNPAAPPPVVGPVSNSTSMSDMNALRSAQLKAQRQQRQGKLFGRSLMAFVLVGGLIAAALVFGRSLLFTTEWNAQLTPIVNEIEAERGAPFDHTVGLETLDPTEFGDRLRAATIGDAWVDDVPAWRALNLTTGIVTAESVAAEMAQDTLARYDADGDVILVVADADPDEARADLRLALEAAYVAQNGPSAPADSPDALSEGVTGFVGVSPTMTIATRAVDNFLADTPTTAERRPASETLPIPIAYQLAAVRTLGESILVAADLDPASLSVGEPYPESIGDAFDDDPMTTASALLQPGERSLADPVALGNDDWALVWSTRLPGPTVDRLVEEVVADSYRPINREGRTCVVGVFQTADEQGGGSVLAAMSSWASAAPAASSAVATQLGPTRVQLEVCDPGAENGVAAPAGVADALIDRQQLRLTN